MYHTERYRSFELVPQEDKPLDSEAIVIALEYVKAFDGVKVKWEIKDGVTKLFLDFPGHVSVWNVVDDLMIELADKGYR